MSNRTLKLFVVLIAVLCMQCIAGCGDKQESEYTSQYRVSEISLEEQNYETMWCAMPGELYFADQVLHNGESSLRVGRLDPATKEIGSWQIALPDGMEAANFCVDSTHRCWVLLSSAGDEQSPYLAIYKGEECVVEPFSIASSTDGDVIYRMMGDETGNVCLSGMKKILYVYSESAECIRTVESSNSIGDMYVSFDGDLLLTSDDLSGITVQEFAANSGELSLLAFQEQGYNKRIDRRVFDANKEEILYINSQFIYSYDKNSMESVEILSLIRHGVSGDTIVGLQCYDDRQSLYAVSVGLLGEDVKVYFFERTEEVQDTRKEVLIGTHGGIDNSDLDNMVSFNKTNPDYYVNVVDYSLYDREDLELRVNTDIISGKGQDIIDLRYFNNDMFVEGGLLEDLSTYMERDVDFQQSDYFMNILTASQESGAIYQIPGFIRIHTFVADGAIVGQRDSWTLEDMYEVLEMHPEINSLFGSQRDIVLQELLRTNIGRYYDREQGICNFDSEEFIRLLECCYHYGVEDSSVGSGSEMNQLLYMSYMYTFKEQQYYDSFMEEQMVIGYPSDQGTGDLLASSTLTYCISSYSKNKEGAWEYIKYCLSEEQQSMNLTELAMYQIVYPVRISSFEQVMDILSEQVYLTLEDGTKLKHTLEWMGTQVRIPTQEEIADFRKIVESASQLLKYTDELQHIVIEEANYYFHDQKTVEEVAEVIQNRAQVYANEKD